MKPIEKSGPLTKEETEKAITDFDAQYSTNQGLDKSPVVVQFDTLLISAFGNNPNRDDLGLVFHYGLKHNTQDELIYLISLGIRNSNNNITYAPFPPDKNSATQYYIALANSISGQDIFTNQVQFCKFKKDYKSSLLKKDGSSNKPIDANHPTLVYHEGSELYKFYQEYNNQNPTELFMDHGSAETPSTNALYHLPILRFGKQQSTFCIDDRTHTGRDYKNKAFDAGQLCPPLCGVQPNYNCQ